MNRAAASEALPHAPGLTSPRARPDAPIEGPERRAHPSQAPASPPLSRRERLVKVLIGLGTWKAVLLITVSSVAFSLLIMSAYLLLATDRWDAHTWVSITFSILTPALVAPVVSHVFVGMLYDLDRARQLAHTLAITDSLTGVFNRRYFTTHAESEYQRTASARIPLSVILFDIDLFKSVNDRFGHAVGDEVIQGVAAAVRSCLRGQDVVARYGGEEFVVLLPQADLETAASIAERIRVSVAAHRVTLEGADPIQVTVSLGLAQRSDDTASMTALLNQADRAMYQAKQTGRNRLVASWQ